MTWIIEPWKAEALNKFPEHNFEIQGFETVNELWELLWELLNAARGMKNSQPIIKRIENYASWSFSESGDAAAINGVMQCYYCEINQNKFSSPAIKAHFPKECVNLLSQVIKDILKD